MTALVDGVDSDADVIDLEHLHGSSSRNGCIVYGFFVMCGGDGVQQF
jgi:hypothetical protein